MEIITINVDIEGFREGVSESLVKIARKIPDRKTLGDLIGSGRGDYCYAYCVGGLEEREVPVYSKAVTHKTAEEGIRRAFKREGLTFIGAQMERGEKGFVYNVMFQKAPGDEPKEQIGRIRTITSGLDTPVLDKRVLVGWECRYWYSFYPQSNGAGLVRRIKRG